LLFFALKIIKLHLGEKQARDGEVSGEVQLYCYPWLAVDSQMVARQHKPGPGCQLL